MWILRLCEYYKLHMKDINLITERCSLLPVLRAFQYFSVWNTHGCCYQWPVCCLVAQSCLTLCNPMDCSTPGFHVLHYLLELAQTHVHWVSDAIQPSHPLSSPSPPTFNLSQHQGLFQWVDPLHRVAKVLELQLQHHSFQRTFRVDFL